MVQGTRSTSNGSSGHQNHRSNSQHSVDVFPVQNRNTQGQSGSPVTSAGSTSTGSVVVPVTSSAASAVAAPLTNQNHYSPNLYRPSAIEYGITTTGSPNGPSVEYEAFYHSPAEGGGGPNAVDPNIINTDGGLSYTNLDYGMYGNQGPHPNPGEMSGYSLSDDCSPSTTSSTNTPPGAAAWIPGHGHGNQGASHMLIHNHQLAAHHPSPPPHHHHPSMLHAGGHLHHQYHPGRPQHHHGLLESASSHQQALQSASNLTSPGSGSPIGMQPAQMGPHSPQQQHQQHPQQTLNNHPQSNSNQSNVQQFKWMQIKRNVPKPSGE